MTTSLGLGLQGMVVPLQTALQAALSGIVAEAGQVGPQAGQDSPAERTGMPRRRPAHAGLQGRSERRQRQGRASRGWREGVAESPRCSRGDAFTSRAAPGHCEAEVAQRPRVQPLH